MAYVGPTCGYSGSIGGTCGALDRVGSQMAYGPGDYIKSLRCCSFRLGLDLFGA